MSEPRDKDAILAAIERAHELLDGLGLQTENDEDVNFVLFNSTEKGCQIIGAPNSFFLSEIVLVSLTLLRKHASDSLFDDTMQAVLELDEIDCSDVTKVH